jgi:predicted RNA-binding protein YlxR (DUF448 family)
MLAHLPHAETDAGPRRSARETERMCVATRQVRPVGEMIRFVAGPDRLVTPDIRRRLPGRGVWVSGTRQAVAEAVKRGAFRRSLRADVGVPPDLVAAVERLLERAVLDALAIANKAGRVAAGFARVEEAIASAPLAALIHASDAGPEGVRKIAAAVRRRYGDAAGPPVINCFASAHLDLALGRPNVIHAALLAGRASDALLKRWQDLERFRTGDAGERGGEGQPR